MNHVRIQQVLDELVGQRCEGVDNPHGSVLRLDIGPLGTRVDAPDDPPHGWRHLTILSPWRLESRTEVVCDWNEPGGPTGSLLAKVQSLAGVAVTSATASPPGWDLVIEWSNGTRLLVFSDRNDNREDAWVILGTDGLELGAGPATAGHTGIDLKEG